MKSPEAPNIIYVSQTIICKKFNESQYPKMIADGDLRSEYLRNSHLREPEAIGEPPCTHSQLLRYYDGEGQWLVEVHQYLRNDHTFGASGMPDPKRLRIGDTIYVEEKQAPR